MGTSLHKIHFDKQQHQKPNFRHHFNTLKEDRD